jgi:hypothetical protein
MAYANQENFLPLTEEKRPHKFLSLAPVISESYPATPVFKAPVSSSSSSPVQQAKTSFLSNSHEPSAATESGIPSAPLDNEQLQIKTRRSSSVTSDGSGRGPRRRFLKLGPVHFGVGDGDWSEDVIEE